MSAQTMIDVVSDAFKYKDLIKLVHQQLLIEESIATYKEELDDIKANFTELGLKPKEFKDLCKYFKNPELLYNELATLEQYTYCIPEGE